MKNIGIFIIACLALTTVGCKKSYVGDTYDFSNSLPSYAEFASKTALTAKQGASINVVVQMKTALTEDVTVNYEITGTTAVITGSAVILRNTVKVTKAIVLPTGIVATGSVVAQIKMLSATKGTVILRVGQIAPTSEVIKLTINP